jgi:hypothetical protein
MDELMTLIARMIHHYHEGGVGYTRLDAAIDTVGEHGYTILSENGDADGPAAVFINDETLKSTRQLIERLRQIGAATETAISGNLEELDEKAAVTHETLSDLFTAALVDNGLVEPFVTSEGF